MPSLTLREIADAVGIFIPEQHEATVIHGIHSLEAAGSGELSFFANRKYAQQCRKSKATAILVPNDFQESIEALAIPVENPSASFAKVIELFRPTDPEPEPGIHPTAVVSPSAQLGDGVSIGPAVVISDHAEVGAGSILMSGCHVGRSVRIGAGCKLYPNVVIREHCQIGNRCALQPGVVIGSDGFGYELVNGRHQKIDQVGIVQIDDDVEIGANTTIDRARFGRTWIQEGAKIDNLVQIAHNVVIGKHSIVVALTGIAGSASVGQYSVIAGQVGVVGHVKIGNQVIVAAKSGISKDVPDGQTMWGSPVATSLREMKERLAHFARLPKLVDRVKALEAKLAALEKE